MIFFICTFVIKKKKNAPAMLLIDFVNLNMLTHFLVINNKNTYIHT